MLLQTNSYIVPKEKRVEHARLLRRFRQALARVGCDHFEVYEQVGSNWTGETTGRFVQIMRFRDRKHQQDVQAAERTDQGAQQLIREFCEVINFPYQQQQGFFAVGFYTSVLPVAPQRTHGNVPGAAADAEVAALEGDVPATPAAPMAPGRPAAPPAAGGVGGISAAAVTGASMAGMSGNWQQHIITEPAPAPHDSRVYDAPAQQATEDAPTTPAPEDTAEASELDEALSAIEASEGASADDAAAGMETVEGELVSAETTDEPEEAAGEHGSDAVGYEQAIEEIVAGDGAEPTEAEPLIVDDTEVDEEADASSGSVFNDATAVSDQGPADEGELGDDAAFELLRDEADPDADEADQPENDRGRAWR